MSFKSNGELYAVHYYMKEVLECKLNEMATRIYNRTKLSEGTYNLKRLSPGGRNYRFSFPNSNAMWMYLKDPYEVDGVKYPSEVSVYKRK